ncbi:MAG: glycosyl transferase family 2 [uncultured bacterium]|nr:MAG: glycosyl transferase family 2 [uncultured bacterium]HBD05591.1 hypothetical protein [Candidatus Uhrbacteria bacterium]
MDISIVIVNYKVADLLLRCLKSIYEHVHGVNFEIFVIDNASEDGLIDRIRNNFPGVITIQNRENLGFAGACNQGIKLAKGEFVLLLNPDTMLIDDSVSKIVQRMRTEPNTAIGGIHLLNPDLTDQEGAVRSFPRIIDQLQILLKIPHIIETRTVRKYLMRDFDMTHDANVDQVMGAFFCIRRSVLDLIGLLDDEIFYWFEEVDLCKRAVDAGFDVKYFSYIRAIHEKGHSFRQVATLQKQTILRKSLRHYAKKHFSLQARLILLILEPVFFVLALVAHIIKPK